MTAKTTTAWTNENDLHTDRDLLPTVTVTINDSDPDESGDQRAFVLVKGHNAKQHARQIAEWSESAAELAAEFPNDDLTRHDLNPIFLNLLNEAVRRNVIDAAEVFVMATNSPSAATTAEEIIHAAYANRHSAKGKADHAALCELVDAFNATASK